MGKCVEDGVALNFFTPNGHLLAHVHGTTKGNIFLRAEQFRIFAEPPIILAQNTVATKISNFPRQPPSYFPQVAPHMGCVS